MMAPFNEIPVVFDCCGERLLGVVCAPAEPSALGVVIVVGGPQYRAGSHRQFVHLARHLGASGVASLRFDVRGMGDSTGDPRSFEQLSDDIGSAIDTLLAKVPGLGQVVLWGLCDGASAALIYVHERRDARVRGVLASNPWARSEASLVRTQVRHYYLDRLRDRAFWSKLVRGGVGLAALREFAGKLRQVASSRSTPGATIAGPSSFQDRMAAGARALGPRLAIILSEHDYTAKEFMEFIAVDPAWADLHRDIGQRIVTLSGADHTFSRAADKAQVAATTCAFVGQLARLA